MRRHAGQRAGRPRVAAAAAALGLLAALAAWASSPAGDASRGGGLAPGERALLLADLPDEPRQAVADVAAGTPRELLEAIHAAGPVYEISTGPIAAGADLRWFATVPPGGEAAPELVLRRWPGDTLLALWALEGQGQPAEAGEHGGETPARPAVEIPGASLEPVEAAEAGAREWRGTLATEAGEHPAIWIQREVEGTTRRLGALLLPGDAGFGTEGVPSLTAELRHVLSRVVTDGSRWSVLPVVPAGGRLRLPAPGSPPGTADEGLDPWQVVLGGEFTLGLPPGMRARRMDRAVPPPVPLPGASLWLRGRFVDRDGLAVVVGDGHRYGYVAMRPGPPDGWANGTLAPLGAPGASRTATDGFSSAAEETGSRRARAERWREPGFEGDWLVFRLVREGTGVEIALPVVEGWRSPALFWLPVTWRPADRPPAPPPVDPAERFGIRFERLRKIDRRDQPWIEGYLTVPGLRLSLPRDWWPLIALRSREGYPVRLIDAGGRGQPGGAPGVEVGRLVRLDPAQVAALGDAEGPPWKTPDGGGRRARRAARRAADGAALWVMERGAGLLLEPTDALAGADRRRQAWERMVDSARPAGTGP